MHKQITHLSAEIERHNHLYYVENEPVISDHQYDAMFQKLQTLEAQHPEFADPNSPITRLGNDTTNRFAKYSHPYPMLSVKSYYEKKDIILLLSNKSFPVVVEWKYDGVAIELQYNGGQLRRALTRGNGTIGEDVTENIRTIANIPLKISDQASITIRGEVVMRTSEMQRLNKLRKKQGKEPYKHPRNAAASLVKAKTPAETAVAHLEAVIFEIKHPVYNYMQGIEAINELGFKTSVKQFTDARHSFRIIEKMLHTEKCEYPTDGIIIKMTDQSDREKADATQRHYNWAWAYKPENPIFETTLRQIAYSHSTSGKITPMLVFDEIQYFGTRFIRVPAKPNIELPTPGTTIRIQIVGGITAKRITEIPNNKISPAVNSNILICPDCKQPLTANRCITAWCPARTTDHSVISAALPGWHTHELTPGTFKLTYAKVRHAAIELPVIVARKSTGSQTSVIYYQSHEQLADLAYNIGNKHLE